MEGRILSLFNARSEFSGLTIGNPNCLPIESRGFLRLHPQFLARFLFMLGETLSNLRYFLEPPYPIKKLIFGACFALVASAWCFMQTEYFLKYTSYPTHEEIKDHMAKSKALQAQVAQRARDSKRPFPTAPLHQVYFSDTDFIKVKQAYDKVVTDQALEKVLQGEFQTTLNQVNVVMVPAWEVNMKDYCDEAGITNTEGWQDLEKAKEEGDVGGTTIRDKDPNEIRTLDGVPRVFLMATAFASPPKSLRLAVFHEMLHAMNVPGYRLTVKLPGIKDPVALTRWQNDLSYLAEYKNYVRTAGLETWDKNVPPVATGVFLLFLAMNLLALFRHYRWRTDMY